MTSVFLVCASKSAANQQIQDALAELPVGEQVKLTCWNPTQWGAFVGAVYQQMPRAIVLVLEPELSTQLLGWCRVLKYDARTQGIPVFLVSSVFLADKTQADLSTEFRHGADACLVFDPTKPEQFVKAFLEEYQAVSHLYADVALEPLSAETLHEHIGQLLARTITEASLMQEFRALADVAHDRNLLQYMLFSLCEEILPYGAMALYTAESQPQLTFHIPQGKAMTQAGLNSLKEGLADTLRLSAETLQTEVIGTLDETTPSPIFRTTHCVPVYVQQQLVGAYAFYYPDAAVNVQAFPYPLIESELNLLFRLQHNHHRSEQMAYQDSVTQAFTLRYLHQSLEREIQRSNRYGLDLSVAIISIDNFKALNAVWGFLFGDEALRHVAQLAKAQFRNTDVVARSGSAEFMVLFPETDVEQARLACERFQKAVSEALLAWTPNQQTIDFRQNDSASAARKALQNTGGKIRLTVSMGLASVSGDTPIGQATPQQAGALLSSYDPIQQAYYALTMAKKQGGHVLYHFADLETAPVNF